MLLISCSMLIALTSCNLNFFPSDEVNSSALSNSYEGLCNMTDGNYAMLKDNMEYQGTTSTSYTFVRRGLEMVAFSNDELMISGRTTSTIFNAYTLERDATLQNVSYVWWCLYKVIFGANQVIENIVDGQDSQMDYLKGENYFLRAFSHLWLCNIYATPYSFGREKPGVVIRTSTNTSVTTRATVGECYDQIVADLQEAIRLMSNGGTRRGNNGYASLEAAQGLLTRVYLHREENEKVIALVNQMLGDASVESKLMTKEELPTYYANTKTAHETLFCIAYTTLDGGALGQSLYAGMLLNDPESGLGWGEAYPTDTQLDLYERYPEDLRYSVFILPQITDSAVQVIRYPLRGQDYRDARSNQLCTATPLADGSYTFLDANNNTCTAWQEMVNGYPLYYATINGEKTQVHLTYKMKQRNTFPNYFITKFSYQDGMAMLGSPSMLRWAEVLLNRAEAYAKTGKDAEALADVNVLRTRAGIRPEGMMTITNMAERGYATTLDVVLDERRLELAFEGFRTIDLMRNHRAINRRFPGLQSWQIVEPDDPRLIYPIPFDEVSVSGIAQNPGY